MNDTGEKKREAHTHTSIKCIERLQYLYMCVQSYTYLHVHELDINHERNKRGREGDTQTHA